MKILMAANTYSNMVGGLERSVQTFTQKYREWGQEVMIAGPDFAGQDFEDQDKGKKKRKPPSALAWPFPARLERKVAAFKPDVIHAHHPFLIGEMALRFSAYYAKPVIFTYHILFAEYAHYLGVFPPAFAERFLVKMTAGFCNLTDRVIAPSGSVREILKSQGVKVPIDVVPTGIETAVYENGNGAKKRKELNLPEKAVVFGHIGRFAEEKNLGFLAQQAAQIMKENPGVYFLAVGKGPSEETIKRIFEEAGVAERLRMPGSFSGQDLTDAYHALDAFVFASKSETQGLVLCEAMAAGIPVIALDAPGVREVVKDFENGRLIMEEDGSQFQDAFSWFLAQNAAARKKLSENAQKMASEFAIEITARNALKTYRTAAVDYEERFKKNALMRCWLWRCVKTELSIIGNIAWAFLTALFGLLAKRKDPE